LIATILILSTLGTPGAPSAPVSDAQLELTVEPSWRASAYDDFSADFDTSLFAGSGKSIEPDYQRSRRRKRRRGRRPNRYAQRERTLGFTLQTGFALPIGNTIGSAYGIGGMALGRFVFHLGDSALVFFDIRWSYHVLKNARPLFFRTAFGPSSTEGGTLQLLSPAIFYGYSIPLGYGYRNRAKINPKFYFGVGPDFTFAEAFVTNAGDLGTVRGRGTQAFIAFIPGLGIDFRLNSFFFLGADFRYHLTLPLARPSLSEEFTIPRLQVLEGGIALTYYFY
jgi:hypothetical protein